MTKKLSRVLGIAVLLGGLGFMLSRSAMGQSIVTEIIDNASGTFKIPLSLNRVADAFRRWSRPSFFAVGGNSACGLAYAGKGIVTSISGQGQASDGIRLYDSVSVGALTYGTLDTTKLVGAISIDTAKVSGQYEYAGIPFTSGLVVCPATVNAYASVMFVKQQ